MLVALVTALCLSLFPQERIPFEETKASGERVVGGRITLEDGREVLHGPFQSFHANGKSESKGEYERGRRTGAWEFRGLDGKMLRRGQFKHGLEEGTWVHFHGGTNKKSSERTYRSGIPCGKWTFWNEEGKPLARPEWKIEEQRDAGRVTVSGATLEGQKDGYWVYRWPNGVARFLANYGFGKLQELYFVHADGTYDPDWLSTKENELPEWAELRIGVAEAELAPQPATDAAREELAGWLATDGTAVPDALLERRRELIPAALEELARCDFTEAEGLARAQRLHGFLQACFGGLGWKWSESKAPLLARRWKSAWSLLADDAGAWEIDFHPRWRWLGLELEESRLGRPPQLEPVRDIGGRFGARLGGPPKGWPTEELARAGRWLVSRQGDDGLWHETPGREQADTALALLVLFGDASFPRRGTHSARVRAGVLALHERIGASDGGPLDLRSHALHLWLFSELLELEGGRGLHAEVQRLAASLLARADENGDFAADPEDDALARYALAVAYSSGCKLDKKMFARFLARTLESGRLAATSSPVPGVPARVGGALLVHLLTGEARRKQEQLEPIVAWFSKNGPAPVASRFDFVFTLWAARQIGKPAWPLWESSWSALQGTWKKDGSHPGSGSRGESLFETTCMAALAAQALHRMPALYLVQR